MRRMFFALPLDAVPVRRELSDFQEKLKPLIPLVRWVRPENFHITLCFVGETPESRLPLLRKVGGEIFFRPFRFRCGGFGAFPSPGGASVLWVGLSEGVSAVSELAGALSAGLSAAGIPVDGKRIKPHITLGRTRGKTDCSALSERFDSGISLLRNEFVLMESVPGGTYRIADRFCAAGNA